MYYALPMQMMRKLILVIFILTLGVILLKYDNVLFMLVSIVSGGPSLSLSTPLATFILSGVALCSIIAFAVEYIPSSFDVKNFH